MAVVGAHLSGQPLNWQLTQRGGRLVRTCRTHPDYKFYALQGTIPPKPGLVHVPGYEGPGIEVEIWALPEDTVGSFVEGVPPPLCIGTLRLEDGTQVKGFLAEPVWHRKRHRDHPLRRLAKLSCNRSSSGPSLTPGVHGFNRLAAFPSREFER